MKIAENTTLKEIKEICQKHQKANMDCETCKFYTFCMYQVCRYPSGWELEVTHEKK